MSNLDERYLLIGSLLPDDWDLKLEDDYAIITNPEGIEKKIIYTSTDEDDTNSYVVDGKALYIDKDSEQEMEILIPFIFQCFDGVQRI